MDIFTKQSQPEQATGTTGFTNAQIGQYFWVRHASGQVRLQLVAITGQRGLFQLRNSVLSVHYTNAIPDYPQEDDSMSGDSEVDEAWKVEAAEIEKATNSFNDAQEQYRPVVSTALKLAIAKVQKAIAGLQTAQDQTEGAFLNPMKNLCAYMEKNAEELAGVFLCLPNEDGPQKTEIATAGEHHINLYKPFFAASMTISKQADALIHESVHSCLKVIDYAYRWQHIFRFLPPEIRLKNPDSYVALACKFSGETVETPHSNDDRYDYTVGMIQHICYRGSSLLRERQKELPDPLEMLKIIRPTYQQEQLTSLRTLATSPKLKRITGAIAAGKFQLIYAQPVPTKLNEAKAEMKDDGTIIVSYIKPAEARPYVGILAKLLTELEYDKWAVIVAKALDDVTAKWHMPVINGPSL